MTDFSIEKFNPTVAELTTLAQSYENLSIDGIEDKEWYEMVKRAQLDLRDKRLFIVATMKNYRQEAIDFQKKVIEKEKELVAIIDGTEKALKIKREEIDELAKQEERKKILPARKDELERNGIVADDEYVLSLTSDQFNKFVMDKREENLLKKQKEIEEQQQQVLFDKRLNVLNSKAVFTPYLTKERIVSFTDEEFDAEVANLVKTKADIEEKAKADAEEKAIKAQQEKERQQQIDKEQQQAREKQAQEALEKDAKYKDWLDKYGYNTDGFMITTNGNEKTMRSKVSTFIM